MKYIGVISVVVFKQYRSPLLTKGAKILSFFLNKELTMQLFVSKEGAHINVLKVRMSKLRMASYRQFFVIAFLLTKT